MTSNAKKSAETAITAPDLFTGGLNPAEIAVGALSRRIPVFVIVDTQEDDREQIAGQLDGVIEWLYNFSPVSSYRNIRPGRISLSIFTASGTCLVPPRLLHQPRPEECGRIYFRNCTWIEKNALKAMLCQLPAEDGIKVDGLKDALGSLLLPQRNAPLNYMSAYAVNDGDAKFITLLLTRRNSEELLKIKLIETWTHYNYTFRRTL